MPGMKQKVTEMVFGREVSDRGETDGRGGNHLILVSFLRFNWYFFHVFP